MGRRTAFPMRKRVGITKSSNHLRLEGWRDFESSRGSLGSFRIRVGGNLGLLGIAPPALRQYQRWALRGQVGAARGHRGSPIFRDPPFGPRGWQLGEKLTLARNVGRALPWRNFALDLSAPGGAAFGLAEDARCPPPSSAVEGGGAPQLHSACSTAPPHSQEPPCEQGQRRALTTGGVIACRRPGMRGPGSRAGCQRKGTGPEHFLITFP